MTETLVFLPPMLCDARVFAHQVAVLSRFCPVMVAPVHLAERCEEVASTLMAALPARFALAGAGYGGAVALEIARRAPERVSKLALVAATALATTPQEASAREPMIIAARMGRMDDVLAHELPRSALAATARRPAVLEMLYRMGADMGPEGYAAQARALQRRRDQTATLRTFRNPALIIGGEEDPIHPPKRQEFLVDLMADAQLELISGAGHLPTLEQPEIVTALLRRWLTQPLILR